MHTAIPDNKICAEGAKALSPALKHLTHLTVLGLAREYCNGCEFRVFEDMCIMRDGWMGHKV